VITTNAVYRCEELERDVSIYDEFNDHHYDDFNENTLPVYLDVLADETEEDLKEKNAYLQLIGDETEGCDQGSEPPLPSPRPITTSQDQNQDQDFEHLKEKTPDYIYLRVVNDKTKGLELSSPRPVNEDLSCDVINEK